MLKINIYIGINAHVTIVTTDDGRRTTECEDRAILKQNSQLQYSKMHLKPIQRWKTLKAKEIASFLEYVGLIKEFLSGHPKCHSFVPKYGNFWKKWVQKMALRVPKRKC